MRKLDGANRMPVPGRSLRLAAALGSVVLLACACSKTPSEAPPPPPAAEGAQPPSAASPGQLSIWLTGYSWQDNTPPGSSIVGEPVLHKEAGGQGTFADPITVAVPGHQGDMDWKPGTKFYLPTVQRYVIVEDSGAAKQPAGTDTHLDMWIDGQDGTKQATDSCENEFTGKVPAQVNPPDNLPVLAGPIYNNQKCAIPPQPADMGTYKDTGSDSDSASSGDNSGSSDNSDSDSSDSDSGDSGHHHHSHHGDDDS